MAAALMFVLLLTFTLFHVSKKIIKGWESSTHKTDSLLSFKPETYTTNLPELVPELDTFFDSFKKLAFSSSEAEEAQKTFLEEHPEIKDMRIVPNYLTGEINIRVEPRKLVSEIKVEGKKAYLAEDGTIIINAKGEKPSLPFDVTLSSTSIPEHLPRFIWQLGEKHEMFARSLKNVSCGSDENSCVLWLNDGTKVEWGTFFYTTRKIEELNHIISVADSKKNGEHSGKLHIDMRYCVSLGRSFYKKLQNSSEKDSKTSGKENIAVPDKV